MSPHDLTDAADSDHANFRRWLLLAFVCSLVLHLGLAVFFYFTRLNHFAEPTQRLVPPAFHVTRVVIDASKLNSSDQEPTKATRKADTAKPKIELPADSESFDKMLSEVHAVPSAPDPVKPLATEKPRVSAATLQSLAIEQKNAAEQVDKELAAVSQQLIQDSTKRPTQPALSLNQLAKAAESGTKGNLEPGSAGTMGYSDLDSLIGEGTLKGPVAPLNFPGGALFDYDKYDLLPASIVTMQKLGKLVQANPEATFTVEGYADSFGDASHNLELSQRRAESVKLWLVSNMEVDPSRIEAVGYGSTKFRVQLATTDASGHPLTLEQQIAQQAPNRRVEIVIKTAQ
jgi:outer membrane protein OmpA-like peptidoglycan-associated protein